MQSKEAFRLTRNALKAYNIQNKAFFKAAKSVEKNKAISYKALAGFIKNVNKKDFSRAQAFS